jgi:L-rhamnose mutarotase
MNRYCFMLQVRAELLPEYVERHRKVWPDMLQALHESGWTDYSIFARDDGADSLEQAQAAMAATEVNGRWQAEMGRYFTGLDGRRPDEGFVRLDQIFNLEDQLASVQEGPGT